MRLFCINNKPLNNCYNESLTEISEGTVYNGRISMGRAPNGEWKNAWFIYETERKYDLSRFISLSNIDERELVNVKEEAYVG